MKLPIDTTGITFLAASAPEPVLDFESKAPKADENGEVLHAVQVVVLAADGADVISVKVAGQPKGVTQGTGLKVTGLVATPWAMNDRSGVSFRATKLEAAGPSVAAPRAA